MPDEVLAIQWTGRNLEDVQSFVGRMQNMDGDVDITRFLEPKALNDDGDRIWENDEPRLWAEARKTWVPVPVGYWVVGLSAYPGYFAEYSDAEFHEYFESEEEN